MKSIIFKIPSQGGSDRGNLSLLIIIYLKIESITSIYPISA